MSNVAHPIRHAVSQFLFVEESSRGFRLMRKAWALTVFFLMLRLAPHLLERYGRFAGTVQTVYVHPYRFSLLLLFEHPYWVVGLYIVLLLSCVCIVFRIYTRACTVLAVILFASFVERELGLFHAEVHVLTTTGFLLALWSAFYPSGPVLPAWLHRLLLWQVVVMYVAAAWYKLYSPSWIHGEAASLAILVSRLDEIFASTITRSFAAAFVGLTYAILVGEAAWVLLLIPGPVESAAGFPRMATIIRRSLLGAGAVVHLAWGALLRDVYPLTLAVLVAYCGLLAGEDFHILRGIRRAEPAVPLRS